MPNWRDSLPDEIKGEASLSNFTEVSDLAKGYIESKKLQGNSIRIPGEDAGEDDVKAFNEKMLDKLPGFMMKPNLDNAEQSADFYRSIGVPVTDDKYGKPEVEEGKTYNVAKVDAFKKMAHKWNLTDKQFKGLALDMIGVDDGVTAANKELAVNNLNAVKSKWGEAHADNMKLVNIALVATKAPESMVNSVKTGEAGVETVEWLYAVGKQLGGAEGNNFGDEFDEINKKRAMSPAEAQDAINEINNNKDHAFWQQDSYAGHKEAVQKMVQLMRWAKAAA